MRSTPFLVIEFFLLCVCLPTYIIVYKMAPDMFKFLWGASAYCLFILLVCYRDHIKTIWKWKSVTWKNMRVILIRWGLACVGMLAFMYFYDPGRLFYLVEERPQIIPFLLCFYPLASALPQELIFCSFFFERYAPFFKTERQKIIASAVVFAYAHILFINWVAPLFSFIAGLIFAVTYSKTRSLALVTIEHGLYGNALFLIGLGWYFYHGAVVQ